MESTETPVTRLLHDWRSGDRQALEKLTPLVYDELRRLARFRLRRERPEHTLQPTALVHEMFLQLTGSGPMEWENRSHFFGIAARLMRQILIQQARVRHAIKRGGGNAKGSLDEAASIAQEPSRSVLELYEALADLIEEDPRKGEIVELRYLWGMTTEEIAQRLGVSASTVEREMRMALPWVRRRIEGGDTRTK